MLYLLVKVVHVVGVIVWVGALILLTRLLSTERLSQPHMKLASGIVEAGIGTAWLAGIVLVLMGGWYSSTWWQIKIVIVVAISAIHTITMTRWKRQGSDASPVNKSIPFFILILTVIIVVLVVLKRPL